MKNREIQNQFEKVLQGDHLTLKEAEDLIESILAGAEEYQVAATLALLRNKGETAEEIAGMAQAMLRHTVPVKTTSPVLDIVGTGGDHANTVNISTGAALVAAAAGVPVAKHGNRAVSSQCGSADVLEEMGISLNQTPQEVIHSIETYGFGFMFAPSFHPAMKVIAPIRKKLKIRTIFNLLGPLLNPSQAQFRLVGVYSPDLVEPIALAIQKMGVKKAYVFHGSGLDELSPIGPSTGLLLDNSGLHPLTIDPAALGIRACTIEELRGGCAKENAHLLKESLFGKTGAITDAIALNAACGLYVYGKVDSMQEGVDLSMRIIHSGKAAALIKNMELQYA